MGELRTVVGPMVDDKFEESSDDDIPYDVSVLHRAGAGKFRSTTSKGEFRGGDAGEGTPVGGDNP